jgi:hypothetical protein
LHPHIPLFPDIVKIEDKMTTLKDVTALITIKGDEIRAAKANNTSKEGIIALVNELLALKERYETLYLLLPSYSHL